MAWDVHVPKRDPIGRGGVLDCKPDTAALRDDADPPFGRDQPRRVGLDVDGRTEGGCDALDFTVKSFRIGTGDPHSGLSGKRSDGILHGCADTTLLSESRGDDDSVPEDG